VFIGQGIDQGGVCASLDACLVTDEEFALQPGEWKGLCEDPFETAQVMFVFVCMCVFVCVCYTSHHDV